MTRPRCDVLEDLLWLLKYEAMMGHDTYIVDKYINALYAEFTVHEQYLREELSARDFFVKYETPHRRWVIRIPSPQ